jgi:hypothetical protein
MLAHYWGLKTFYYSLINKAGSKMASEPTPTEQAQNGYNGFHRVEIELEDDCEACKL